MLLLFAIPAVVLHFTRFGRHLYGIGGNSEAACPTKNLWRR